MGACDFRVSVFGETAGKAFREAVQQAQYNRGHSGYTGTIAEKETFVMIPFDKEGGITAAHKLASELIERGDDRIDDKWGPAGCIEIGSVDGQGPLKKYLFFGWASS